MYPSGDFKVKVKTRGYASYVAGMDSDGKVYFSSDPTDAYLFGYPVAITMMDHINQNYFVDLVSIYSV